MSRVPLRFRWLFKKLKRHKSPGIDQITAEMIKAKDRAFPINSVWNKEELLEYWKDLIIVPISKKGDKRESINYRGISRFSITYKILFNILVSRWSPYAEEIIGHH